MSLSEDIVAEARKMLDTPFVHQGRNPVSGVDCAGLVWCTANALDLERLDEMGYPRNVSTVNVEEVLARCCDVLSERELGCILTFNIPGAGTKHLAIVTPVGMIHAWARAQRVMEHAITKGWAQKISKIYRMRQWQQ